MARHQDAPEDTHRWNAEALTQADAAAAAGDERVRAFFPSLYLNTSHSSEQLGDVAEAARYYDLADVRLGDVPAGAYGDVVPTASRSGAGAQRTGAPNKRVGTSARAHIGAGARWRTAPLA